MMSLSWACVHTAHKAVALGADASTGNSLSHPGLTTQLPWAWTRAGGQEATCRRPSAQLRDLHRRQQTWSSWEAGRDLPKREAPWLSTWADMVGNA